MMRLFCRPMWLVCLVVHLACWLVSGEDALGGSTQGGPIKGESTKGEATKVAKGLPQQHDYQKALRAYLSTLTEKDLELPLLKPLPLPKDLPTDLAYRAWALTAGGGYGIPPFAEVHAPAHQFTLAWIEGGPQVARPPTSPSFYAWLAQWNFPFNPYRGHAVLKRRAFVALIVDLIMHDHLHESDPKGFANRSDFLGGTLIWLGYDYSVCKDVIPRSARAAYESGLKKLVQRLDAWGPRRSMTDMDLFAPVGLHYSALATGDPVIKEIAAKYPSGMLKDRRLFHPAGFFVDAGSFDASYNGISLYFTTWGATATNSALMRDALAKSYRLKSHLMLPEPDGRLVGPTHFNPRTSGDSANDQWSWRFRDTGAAMLTDEALACARPPTAEELQTAPAALLGVFQMALDKKPTPAKAIPWSERHWTMNPLFAEMYYQKGFLERIRKLAGEKSPLLVLPFRRQEEFVRSFEDHFVIAKRKGFGVVLHTGPVSTEDKTTKRPKGFGGGALSAFWTPATGSVMLGRRRGLQGPNWDRLEEWASWPTHAVSALTAAGKVTSSARLQTPSVTSKVDPERTDILVRGPMPDAMWEQGKVLVGKVDYQRRFELAETGLKVTTTLRSDRQDKFRAVVEVLPLYIREGRTPAKDEVFRILYRAGEAWQPVPEAKAVTTVKLRVERFAGAVEIELDQPRTVRLSPKEWIDGYMSFATCRNVLVDLLPGPGEQTFDQLTLSYRITPAH